MRTDDERRCEEIFNDTVTRDDSERYVMKLPFCDDNLTCKKGNFREIAKKRLYQLERKLARNPDQKEVKLEIGSGKEAAAIQKVLRLSWNSSTDEFKYSVQLQPIEVPKRKEISDISRLFDPLGWSASKIITAKIFVQKFCVSSIDWDKPSHLLQEWLTYRTECSHLTNFRVPRWIQENSDDKEVDLFGFSDESFPWRKFTLGLIPPWCLRSSVVTQVDGWIMTVLDRNQGEHVRSKENSANCASRSDKDCDNLSLTKNGPSWLSNVNIDYSPH